MPGIVTVLGTIRVVWDQPNKNPGEHCWCPADIFSNITNCEILQPGMLITRTIGQVCVVECTNNWHNCRSSRKLILCIPPPVARVHLAVDSTTLRVKEAYRLKLKVRLKWEMWQKELDTFENIPVE
jgi:hypothetical protein